MKQIIQSGHELTDAGLVSRETGEVKDTVSFVVESGSYVVTPEQQEQRRKAREERIKKAMLRNGKKAEKFVFVDANINFEGISPAMVTRLLYLSTYAGYKDEIGKDRPKDLGNPIIRNGVHLAALTEHTNLYLNEEQIDTPRQAYERTAEKFNHNEDMISEFWKWCDARDRLNAYYCKYPENFLEWSDNPFEMLKSYRGKPIAVCWKIETATQEMA